VFLVRNEQTKLTAAWLNALGAAIIAAGVFAPVLASLYGVSQPVRSWLLLPLLSATCFAFGAFLHGLGRLALRRLRE
jgi:predicted membrane protein